MRAASLCSLSPRVLITSGCCVSSRTAFFQSILGWKAANQGYPKTSSSSPMWVTRKRISSFLGPTCTCRSTYSLIDPDLLWVPSIFQMYRGFFRDIFPIFILLRSLSLIKLSVAPESTRTSRSAFVCLECKIVGIFNDLYLHENTFLSPKVRAMAAWVAPAKNPAPLGAFLLRILLRRFRHQYQPPGLLLVSFLFRPSWGRSAEYGLSGGNCNIPPSCASLWILLRHCLCVL